MIEMILLKLCLAFFLLFVLPVLLIFCLLGALAKHVGKGIKQDYDRQGGAKVVVPKIVAGTAAKYAGRALKRRFFG
jgi:chromate transport protein ChrA